MDIFILNGYIGKY